MSMLSNRTSAIARSTALLVVALTASSIVAGCTGTEELAPVAVSIDVGLPDSVARGEPVEVEYAWTSADDFVAPADDYQVFVHMEDPDGVIVLQDDHYPPTPTSQWQAGEEIVYRRWIYLPSELEVDYLDVLVGLYTEDGQVPVRHQGEWQARPRLHRVDVRTEDLSVLPVYVEGWYPEEVADGGPRGRWHWTQGRAVAVFVNPRDTAVLHVELHSPVEEIGGPQAIVLRVGDSWSETLQVDAPGPVSQRFEIPASTFGDDDWTQIVLEADPTFVPAEIEPESTDQRTLGAKVFRLLLSPKS